jgi:methyl-CpG-binding domain protein 4
MHVAESNGIQTWKGKTIPKSPFNLLQEIYVEDPWKILVCCIFLNQTTRKQVDGIREKFFERWPSPQHLAKEDAQQIAEQIKSLGFYNRRSKTLQKFSEEWISKDWKSPIELHGIGQYGLDSWKIFVEGEIVEDPADHVLKDYVKWRTSF